MMNIFSALYEMLPEYKDYLDYFFENKETTVIGSSKSTDHGLGIDEAMVELFMPNQKQNSKGFPHVRLRNLSAVAGTCLEAMC
jgi:hypothetical protein